MQNGFGSAREQEPLVLDVDMTLCRLQIAKPETFIAYHEKTVTQSMASSNCAMSIRNLLLVRRIPRRVFALLFFRPLCVFYCSHCYTFFDTSRHQEAGLVVCSCFLLVLRDGLLPAAIRRRSHQGMAPRRRMARWVAV